jgi:hypothetical protein
MQTLLIRIITGIFLGVLTLALIHFGAAPIERFMHAADASGEPLVVVAPAEWDFGRAEPGRLLEARFRVTNRGGRRLVLHRSQESCDCLSTAEPDVLVEPGGSRVVTVQLDTRGKLGTVTADLLLKTNAPRRPILRLSCRAQVN